jgi:hypothetical protein
MPDTADPLREQLRDGGPVFVETPTDLDNYPSWAAEPWNTASALLFVLISLGWLWRLRGRYRRHPFLTVCLPILLVGGVGGMLFHGTRTHALFLLIDVVPIYVLGIAVAAWLWVRLGAKAWHLLGVIVFLALLQLLAQFRLPIQWAISMSYATLAALVLLAVALTLIRTRFRHAGWVYTACAFFATAWICRISDTVRPPIMPMGTHWLWHAFGALTTLALSVYVYRLERVEIQPIQRQLG